MSAYDSNYFKNKKSDLNLSDYFMENLITGCVVLELYFVMKYCKWLHQRKCFQVELDIFSPHSYNKLQFTANA